MKKSTYTTYEELPLFLNDDLVAQVLGISISSAYELIHEKDFPSMRIGNRLIETEHTTVTLKDGRKHNGSLKYNTPADYRSSQISRRNPDAEAEDRTGKTGNRKTSRGVRS